MNKVILKGNLGSDPEIKETNFGSQMGRFKLATNETYQKEGKPVSNTQWHNIVCFGDDVNFIKNLKKGSEFAFEGKINYRTYEGKDGLKKYITEIKFVKPVDL